MGKVRVTKHLPFPSEFTDFDINSDITILELKRLLGDKYNFTENNIKLVDMCREPRNEVVLHNYKNYHYTMIVKDIK